ncbi:MAG TPA: DUF1707 domain-containing protein [Streptosporangiaceae bacterium]
MTPPRHPAGDADRERLIALLREHYARGMLEHDELDRRIGLVLAAEYTDEAAAAVADLPQLAGPGGPGQPARQRQRRGHAQAATPGAGWVPTDERFRDPTTRAVMRVWIDPADQSRHYVPEPG